MKELEQLVRRNIVGMKAVDGYLSIHKRDEKKIFLDGNENPYNKPVNRYPDPLQSEIKAKLSRLKGIIPECIFLGNGADEIIDIIYRCFCEPEKDNVVAITPTYEMYKRMADINNVKYLTTPLDHEFQISANRILSTCNVNTKVIWLCSPNNPSGNDLKREEIISIAKRFHGIVVVDEAYSDFTKQKSMIYELDNCPNIIVLNTFSNAWACAGLRVGVAYAHPLIIGYLNKIKLPYNISSIAQELICKELDNKWETEKWVNIITMERERMTEAFKLLPSCKKVYPTSANFFMARMTDANAIYSYLKSNGIIVKNVSNMPYCDDCLRISVGSKAENSELLSVLRQFKEHRK